MRSSSFEMQEAFSLRLTVRLSFVSIPNRRIKHLYPSGELHRIRHRNIRAGQPHRTGQVRVSASHCPFYQCSYFILIRSCSPSSLLPSLLLGVTQTSHNDTTPSSSRESSPMVHRLLEVLIDLPTVYGVLSSKAQMYYMECMINLRFSLCAVRCIHAKPLSVTITNRQFFNPRGSKEDIGLACRCYSLADAFRCRCSSSHG